jgi:hypothetical protein
MNIKEIVWKGLGIIYYAQNSNQWWAVVNTALYLHVP